MILSTYDSFEFFMKFRCCKTVGLCISIPLVIYIYHRYTYLLKNKRSMKRTFPWFSSVQFSLVAQSCLTLCDPMNRSIPGLHVHHQLPDFTQTHAHRVGDAIQPSHPLSSPSPPAPNPSQHQGLFQ